MNENEKGINKIKEDKEYFHMIPNSVFYDVNLTDKQKLIFAEIYQLAQKNGYCFASNMYLSKKMNVDRTTIIRAITKLKELGYIDTILNYEEHSYNVKSRKIIIKGSGTMQQGSGTSATTEVHKCNRGSGTNATYNNINNNNINELYKNNIYSRAKPDDENEIPYKEIVEYLNTKADREYKTTTNKTRSLIKARYNEGFTLDDFKTVIDNKSASWKGKPDWDKFLRPQTLFGNKFESYLNEKSVVSDYDKTREEFLRGLSI